MRTPILLLTALAVPLASGTSIADPLPETAVPLPYVKPDSPSTAAFNTLLPGGALPRGDRLTPAPVLKIGLDALSDGDMKRTLSVRDGMPAGSLDRQILTWALATSGSSRVPFREVAAAEQELLGWPGVEALRAQAERALFLESAEAATVQAFFKEAPPETPEGRYTLARALDHEGKSEEALEMIRQLWKSDPLDVALENRVLEVFGEGLTKADHKARMDYLMYRSRVSQAKRFSELGEAHSLYKAWTAVIREAKNAGSLLEAVDKSWSDDPAYLFLQIERLRRQDKYEEAAALLKKVPRDATRLINSSEWWDEKRIIARGLADQGDYKRAYEIVSAHDAERATDIVDAEFHAGWYALRNLNDTAAAERHFKRVLELANGPISASRAWYWLGRTAEARAADEASASEVRALYEKAAAYAGSFYGQLAAARIGMKTLNVATPMPSDSDRHTFASRAPVKAIALLQAVGHEKRADTLMKALAKQIISPGELSLLAAEAEKRGDHNLALQIGKTAFSEGRDVAALAFPTGVIPTSANIEGSGKALAYSVARQESAFNPAAVSPANARGLLQLLPGTAKAVAKRHGLAYAPARLTDDPGYNATLGAHYLGEQINSFDGSYVLTFIAYNAGPRRVREWIERYGDPRGKPIEAVVDWIERIPFPETRSYVQRIMENYQVYKTRLGQNADIERDLRFGRQQMAADR
ncbi:soluble lytic murein transglycosylase [Pseudorhizobium tarimense]|uniref:Soluble lytic murein transglycosylase n=1 Tax=Pseudorhizobium tarimense TaxID=1079109 RepID=A0ABV2H692_9HYPH|nr:lytic transglycosylase domain-containing protein [Pseudorhizobium tarimense]MCJ8519100.1 transglycosylase SLT domain-containing protein [Pseudorhizobium tarimense]